MVVFKQFLVTSCDPPEAGASWITVLRSFHPFIRTFLAKNICMARAEEKHLESWTVSHKRKFQEDLLKVINN